MPDLRFLPSLLAADQGRLTEACQSAERAGADGVHVDVMDGHFVPNLNFGPNVVSMAKAAVSNEVNVHLMITDPEKYLDAFLDAGSDTLLVHLEANGDIGQCLERIRARGVRSGIVLNPDTPAEAAYPFMEQADEVLFMTVHPGFGGQKFIESVLPKISAVRERYPEAELAVDGGLNRETTIRAGRAGANVFDIGTGLFGVEDMAQEICWMKEQLV